MNTTLCLSISVPVLRFLKMWQCLHVMALVTTAATRTDTWFFTPSQPQGEATAQKELWGYSWEGAGWLWTKLWSHGVVFFHRLHFTSNSTNAAGMEKFLFLIVWVSWFLCLVCGSSTSNMQYICILNLLPYDFLNQLVFLFFLLFLTRITSHVTLCNDECVVTKQSVIRMLTYVDFFLETMKARSSNFMWW